MSHFHQVNQAFGISCIQKIQVMDNQLAKDIERQHAKEQILIQMITGCGQKCIRTSLDSFLEIYFRELLNQKWMCLHYKRNFDSPIPH